MSTIVDLMYLAVLQHQCEGYVDGLDDVERLASEARVVIGTSYADPLEFERKRIAAIRVLFHRLQFTLSCAANASKILWSPSSKAVAVERGKRLRNLLDVDDDDPIIRQRDLRNDFEHIDERLDDWSVTPQRNIVFQLLGTRESLGTIGDVCSSRSL